MDFENDKFKIEFEVAKYGEPHKALITAKTGETAQLLRGWVAWYCVEHDQKIICEGETHTEVAYEWFRRLRIEDATKKEVEFTMA